MTTNDIINELPLINDLCDEQSREIILPTVQQSYEELGGRLGQYIQFNPFAERNDIGETFQSDLDLDKNYYSEIIQNTENCEYHDKERFKGTGSR